MEAFHQMQPTLKEDTCNPRARTREKGTQPAAAPLCPTGVMRERSLVSRAGWTRCTERERSADGFSPVRMLMRHMRLYSYLSCGQSMLTIDV